MRRLLIVLVLFALPILASAQKFNARANAGIVASQVDGDRYSGYNKFGFTFGADVSRPIEKTDFGWRLGLRYVRKGSHAPKSEESDFYKVELHYAEMPLTALYTYKRFEFEAGASFGYLIKSKEDVDGNGMTEPAFKFKPIELSGVAGVNYNLTGDLWAGAEFSYSMLPIRPYTAAHSDYVLSGEHNNLLMFKIVYLFHAARK
ncbi:MAG: PorT family protein [Salinivirgaceae bacterium]|nr:PorT family protein [Salinivirgaceae bacterium]